MKTGTLISESTISNIPADADIDKLRRDISAAVDKIVAKTKAEYAANAALDSTSPRPHADGDSTESVICNCGACQYVRKQAEDVAPEHADVEPEYRAAYTDRKRPPLEAALKDLINSYGVDEKIGVPDWIIAKALVATLDAAIGMKK